LTFALAAPAWKHVARRGGWLVIAPQGTGLFDYDLLSRNTDTTQNKRIDADQKDFEDAIAAWEEEIKRRREHKERARERLNEEALPRASRLYWIDAAEVYPLCESCYWEKKPGEWTGFTDNPDYWELKETMRERLAEGTPCSICKREEVNEIADELVARDDESGGER
jgi:hypothetical protein